MGDSRRGLVILWGAPQSCLHQQRALCDLRHKLTRTRPYSLAVTIWVMESDLTEVIRQGEDELESRRAQRLRDITEGDIQPDPSLLDVGDEVADEVVSEWKRVGDGNLKLRENRGRGWNGGSSSRWSADEQRAGVSRAHDMILEGVKPKEAYAIVGESMGMAGATVESWGKHHNMPTPILRAQNRNEQWTLQRRQNLFDEQMDIVSMLTSRMKVWLTDQNPEIKPPEDWNAANELKTIAVAAAIIHDKRSHIEDLMVARGIRDLDSEELQGELSAGKQRLIEMGVSDGEEEVGVEVHELSDGVSGDGPAVS